MRTRVTPISMGEETSLEKTEQAVALAREWIGTPYQHQACLKGVGVDCVGLIRGVYHGLYGVEAPELINYSADWGDSNGNETMVAAAEKYLEPVPLDQLASGHVVLLRWQKHRVAKHSMILTGPETAIHAYNNSPVTEINLHRFWLSKIVYAYTWPEEVK